MAFFCAGNQGFSDGGEGVVGWMLSIVYICIYHPF